MNLGKAISLALYETFGIQFHFTLKITLYDLCYFKGKGSKDYECSNILNEVIWLRSISPDSKSIYIFTFFSVPCSF